jgi:hypothetical protein
MGPPEPSRWHAEQPAGRARGIAEFDQPGNMRPLPRQRTRERIPFLLPDETGRGIGQGLFI